MKRKMARLLSVSIVLIFTLSLLTGCFDTEKKGSEQTPVDSGKEAATPSSTKAGDEKDKGYVPTQNLDLTIWNTQGTDVNAVEKPKEDIPGDWLVNKTKVKIKEFYGNGGGQWEAKLTTLVASGNLPNLVLTQAGQGPAHHAKLHEGDLNWELTPEMIQKYAPDVWKSVPSYVWDSIKVDGKIYGIPFGLSVDKEVDPNLSDEFVTAFTIPRERITSTSGTLMVRDDILKSLIPSALSYEEVMKLIKEKNAPIGDSFILPIKSTDEYVKFMYDIKALNLKAGNKPVYATGYDGGDNWFALSVLGSEMLGYKGYYYTGYLNIPQKKMRFGYLDSVFKEAAQIQNKMINDRVIDPESLVHNAEKYKEKVLNGQYAIIWNATAGDVNPLLEKAGKSFRYVPFYTQVPQRPEFPAYKEGPPTFSSTLSLLKTLKEDEVPQVLNWINTMFTDEWEDIKFWGTKEAGLYDELPDGKRKFKDANMQKLLVDLDRSAMDWKDTKGLSFDNLLLNGGSPGFWPGVVKWNGLGSSKYNPQFLNKSINYTTINDAMKFPSSSPWATGFVLVPNVQSFSAEYANVPEVQKLWSTRATWDDPFKVALTAKNEELFSKKWDAAIVNFRKTVDVDKMLEEQTKIALPLFEKRAAQAKQ